MKGEFYVCLPRDYADVSSFLEWPRIGDGFRASSVNEARSIASGILRDCGLRFGVLAKIGKTSVTFLCTVSHDNCYCPYITCKGKTIVQDESEFTEWKSIKKWRNV